VLISAIPIVYNILSTIFFGERVWGKEKFQRFLFDLSIKVVFAP
jgi:hypothetical protein